MMAGFRQTFAVVCFTFVFSMIFIIFSQNSIITNSVIQYAYSKYNNDYSLNNTEIYFQKTIKGIKPFSPQTISYLGALNLLEKDIENVNDTFVLNSNPVIVSAISSNHLKEFQNLLSDLRVLNMAKLVYLYDIGLT